MNPRRLIPLAALACTLAFLGAVSSAVPSAERAPAPGDAATAPTIRADQIAVFWPLGSASGAKAGNPFNQGFGVHEPGGFDRWVSKFVKPLYDRGFRRLIVHNPMGNDPESKNMDLDQAYDAYERGRGWNVTEFDAALQRIGREMPGMRVIVYIGTRNETTSRAADEGRVRDHFIRSASMVLLTRILDYDHVTLAFDAASNYENDSPERYLVEMVRAYKERQALPVYVEPIPVQSWERGFSWIALERYYAKHTQRAATMTAPDAIRIYNTPGDFDAWDNDAWAWIADCVREGHTPAIGWNIDNDKTYPWAGMNAAQIAQRATALAARPGSPRP